MLGLVRGRWAVSQKHTLTQAFSLSASASFITQFYVLGCFVKFGRFLGIFRRKNISQRMGKIRRNKTFSRFSVVLKLEVEVKNYSKMDTDWQSPTNLGCSCAGVNCLVVFYTQFSFFIPTLNPLKWYFQVKSSLNRI